jgi:hypothetical protein
MSSRNIPHLPDLGVYGFDRYEPVILASLVTEDPMLLIGRSGTGKTFLTSRLVEDLISILRKAPPEPRKLASSDENAWEEIVAQAKHDRGEISGYSRTLIGQTMESLMENLSAFSLLELWLATAQGQACWEMAPPKSLHLAPLRLNDIVSLVSQRVYNVARYS